MVSLLGYAKLIPQPSQAHLWGCVVESRGRAGGRERGAGVEVDEEEEPDSRFPEVPEGVGTHGYRSVRGGSTCALNSTIGCARTSAHFRGGFVVTLNVVFCTYVF